MRSEELQVKEKLLRRKRRRRRRGGALRSVALFICPALVHPPKSGCLLLHNGGLLLLCARAARMPISFFLPHSLSLAQKRRRRRRRSRVTHCPPAQKRRRRRRRSRVTHCPPAAILFPGTVEGRYLPTYLPRFSQILAINQKWSKNCLIIDLCCRFGYSHENQVYSTTNI